MDAERELDREHYLNRELSWLAFNRRVLEEARDRRHPLLERVKFLSIFSSNLDEFFMIRVSGIKEQLEAGISHTAPDGLSPQHQLELIHVVVQELVHEQRAIFYDELLPELGAAGIGLHGYAELALDEQRAVDAYFDREIFPILTPLAIDPSHPFPHISNLSLNLALLIRDEDGEENIARVKIPEVLPRLLPLGRVDERFARSGGARFVWIEDVITANLASLFPGMSIVEVHPFRITRDADMEIQEDEAADLMRSIEQSVRQRRFGSVVRFSALPELQGELLEVLVDRLQISAHDMYVVRGPLGLRALRELLALDRPDLKDPPFAPAVPATIARASDIFSAIRHRDLLLHHPYDAFDPVVDFINQAAQDPHVLAIKQTLYRVGPNSPIVEALLHARERGKQVAVLVELKARFDEEHNIEWARAMERVGVHVAYGLIGLKTHCKAALVVRHEHDGVRRYVHLGTGNYNAITAHIYTDLSLFTCNAEIGADASELFNYLTGYSLQRSYRQLLVAPVTIRERLFAMIEREIAHQEAGRPGHLIFKTNALVDPATIALLYRASQAGVRVDLIVRGVCCLRPGVPGLSENIMVRSIVGRFLEHSRIYFFRNGGEPQIYVGSADLMQRNLNRRVEVLFPILDPALCDYLASDVLGVALRDTSRARLLQPDGIYHRAEPRPGEAVLDSQQWLLERHLSGGGAGSAPPPGTT